MKRIKVPLPILQGQRKRIFACFLVFWPLMDFFVFYTSVEETHFKWKDFYDFSVVEKPFGEISFNRIRPIHRKILEGQLINTVPTAIRKNMSEILENTLRLAEWYRVDPFWVLAVMWTESHYKVDSRSSKGAIGLMQLMPDTGTHLQQLMEASFFSHAYIQSECEEVIPFPRMYRDSFKAPFSPIKPIHDPYMNIELGIVYLKCLLKIFNDDPALATIAYNMGPYRTKHRLNLNYKLRRKSSYLKKVKENYQKLSANVGNF